MKEIVLARQTVQQLGQLEDGYAIKAFLEAERVHGHRLSPYDCALSVYLQRITGWERIFASVEETILRCTVIRHSYQLNQFLRSFDAGHFPALDTEFFPHCEALRREPQAPGRHRAELVGQVAEQLDEVGDLLDLAPNVAGVSSIFQLDELVLPIESGCGAPDHPVRVPCEPASIG
jgi:hypothetical protein